MKNMEKNYAIFYYFMGEDSYLCAHAVELKVVMQEIFLLLFFEYDTTRFDEWLLLYYVTLILIRRRQEWTLE